MKSTQNFGAETVVKRLTYRDSDHTYWYMSRSKLRLVVPGITSILARAGLSNIENVTPEALTRGTAVHSACEADLEKTRDFAGECKRCGDPCYDGNDVRHECPPGFLTTDNEVAAYLDGFRRFIRDTGYTPVESERVIFSKQHWYAGRLDCILEMSSLKKRKRRLLVEIKTNTRPDCVGVQLSAQKWAAQECGLRVDEAGCLVLKPNSYSWWEHKTSQQDWQRFQEALKK